MTLGESMPRRAPWSAQDAGQGLVEYAVILGLTSLCIVLALLVLRASIANSVQGTTGTIEAAGLSPVRPDKAR
jgi:Flp pilus assembly pilin Flp